MQKSDENLCFQWNEFRNNVSSAFGDLRAGKEFTDVTLACEDGEQVEKVDKVVLTLSSPFFLPYSGFSLSQAKAPLQLVHNS